MIRRIDHVIAIVEDVADLRARLLDIGCPLVWDGRSGEHRDTLFSLGPARLELLSPGAFDGWPALTDLAAQTSRALGLRVTALDPRPLDQTVQRLRGLGLAVTDPQPGALSALDAEPGALPIATWRNAYVDGLRGLLPGLPAFLCEVADPGPDAENVPLRFAELRVGVADVPAAAEQYGKVFGLVPQPSDDGASVLIPVPRTPLRLVQGSGLQVMVRPTRAGLPLADLQARLPGLVCTDAL